MFSGTKLKGEGKLVVFLVWLPLTSVIFLGINLLHAGGNGEGLGIYSGTRARGQCLVLRVEKWQLVNKDHASQSNFRPSEFIGGQLFFKNNARKKINIGNQSKPDNQQEKKIMFSSWLPAVWKIFKACHQDLFVKLTEEARRERLRRLDAGKTTRKLQRLEGFFVGGKDK